MKVVTGDKYESNKFDEKISRSNQNQMKSTKDPIILNNVTKFMNSDLRKTMNSFLTLTPGDGKKIANSRFVIDSTQNSRSPLKRRKLIQVKRISGNLLGQLHSTQSEEESGKSHLLNGNIFNIPSAQTNIVESSEGELITGDYVSCWFIVFRLKILF